MRLTIYGEPAHGRTASPDFIFGLLAFMGMPVRIIDNITERTP